MPAISISAGAYQGWNARFRVDVTAKDTSALALLGVDSGPAAAAGGEPTIDGPGGSGRFSGLKYYDYAGTRRPVVQAQLYKDDVAEAQKRTDISLMFMNRSGLSNVTFPVRVYGGASGAGLHSVTLDPIGTALDVQRATGESNGTTLVTTQAIPWSAVGLLGGHGDTAGTGQAADIFDFRQGASESGTAGEMQLLANPFPNNGTFGMFSTYMRTDAAFHQWSLHVTRTEGGNCSPTSRLNDGVTSTNVNLFGIAAGGAGKQFFATAPSATLSQFSISPAWCDATNNAGPTVYFDRINLATRPAGGAPAIAP
jgi:hypothetical protein